MPAVNDYEFSLSSSRLIFHMLKSVACLRRNTCS